MGAISLLAVCLLNFDENVKRFLGTPSAIAPNGGC
jgi:hypothetical protein